MLTGEQIQDINEFAEMRRADVELTGEDFDTRRKIIDLLDGQDSTSPVDEAGELH